MPVLKDFSIPGVLVVTAAVVCYACNGFNSQQRELNPHRSTYRPPELSCSEPGLSSGDLHCVTTCLAKHFSNLLSCTSCTKLRFLVLQRICIIPYTARSKAVREHYTSGECRLDFYISKAILSFAFKPLTLEETFFRVLQIHPGA